LATVTGRICLCSLHDAVIRMWRAKLQLQEVVSLVLGLNLVRFTNWLTCVCFSTDL
jgi:hypothetical protein